MDELDIQLHEALAEQQRVLRQMTKAQRHRYFEKMFLMDFKEEIDGKEHDEKAVREDHSIDDGWWSGVNLVRPAFMGFMELAGAGEGRDADRQGIRTGIANRHIQIFSHLFFSYWHNSPNMIYFQDSEPKIG